MPYRKVKAGDLLVSEGPCGGGYGKPLERDPMRVRDDVLDGYISASTALADFGVVIDARAVNMAATVAERARRA